MLPSSLTKAFRGEKTRKSDTAGIRNVVYGKVHLIEAAPAVILPAFRESHPALLWQAEPGLDRRLHLPNYSGMDDARSPFQFCHRNAADALHIERAGF